jgi:hypothetical protein
MNRYIFILLVNVILALGTKAKCYADPSCIISKYDLHDSSANEMELSQISIDSIGLIEGNDILTNHFSPGNKSLPYENHPTDRQYKLSVSLKNINLRYFIRKDIHFLSVLLI